MASKALSLSELVRDANTIVVGGTTITTDQATGAVVIISPVTNSVANPTAIVISANGGIGTVTTTAGVVDSANIALAQATAVPGGGGNVDASALLSPFLLMGS